MKNEKMENVIWVAHPVDPELAKVRDYDTIFTVEDAAED